MRAAIDNDLLIKGAWYLLLPEMVAAIPANAADCIVLGAAKFVCIASLEKRGLAARAEVLNAFIGGLAQIEPSAEELAVAAEIELLAQQRGLSLDVGESQLLAIGESRAISVLATGDKRAIRAIEGVMLSRGQDEFWRNKVICLEQIIRSMLLQVSPDVVRDRVCQANLADRAISICFSCSSGGGDVSSWISGLESYIEDLRSKAPVVLSA